MSSHEAACQRVAARFRKPWLRHYVGSKLRSDPVFAAAFEALHSSTLPLLDVGCGVGLLAFYLRERGFTSPITGCDIDGRKIGEGKSVSRDHYPATELFEQDVTNPLPEFTGNVALFDVLHYLPSEQQPTLLRELARRVAPNGVLLIRDCPRDDSARFWMTYAGEKFAQAISWNVRVPLHFPQRELISASFPETEFTHEEQPAWGRTPFNNRLFTFRRRR
jgi:2-polyprenyl-3-methyl-5-hydroxy-6-metoxy-1,4-benzoquinol methylase